MRFRLSCALALALSSVLGAAPAPLPPAGSVVLAPTAPGAPGSPVAPLGATDAVFGDLLVLPNEFVTVRYPPETLDRAARVQARLVALDHLWSPFAHKPLGWSAVILHRDAWLRSGFGAAWGAPVRFGPGQFALPAEGDAETVRFARALAAGALPDPGGLPVLGTGEEASSLLVADFLLQIEAARDFTELAQLAGDAPWVRGVLMQLAIRYAWERAEPEQTLGYVALYDAISAAHGGPRARRLADYREGLPYETELWYQAQFVRGADAIWIETGWMGASRRLYNWSLKGAKGKPLAVAELEKKFPAIVEWERTSFAP